MKEILEPLLTITKKPLAQCAAAAKKKANDCSQYAS